MGCLLLYAGLGQKLPQKMALICGLLLYPGLLYPGLTLCCSIVQSTGNRKVALISGLLLYPGLLYPGSTVYIYLSAFLINQIVQRPIS